MNAKQSIWLVMTMVISMALFACNNSTPDTATIHGTIIFRNVGAWAASGTHTIADVDSGVVEVVIFPAFQLDSIHPEQSTGWGDVPANFYGPGSPAGRFAVNAPSNAQNPSVLTRIAAGSYGAGGDSTYEYTIEGLDPGTYSCLAVGFRTNRNVSASYKTATLGVYWNQPETVSHGIIVSPYFNDPAPSLIVLAKGDNVQYDFKADFGFVNYWPF